MHSFSTKSANYQNDPLQSSVALLLLTASPKGKLFFKIPAYRSIIGVKGC